MKKIRINRRGVLGSLLLMAAALALVACGGEPKTNASTPVTGAEREPALTAEPVYRYNQVLNRDSIRPIYDPEFVHADEAQIKDEELVLAIAIDGQAKAYPITVLNSREMVNDELAGIPILATW